MKLNVRLILISFVIVLVVSVSSTFIYYSLAGSLISKQQSQAILNSTNDFVFTFQNVIQKTEEDFNRIKPKLNNIKSINLDGTSVDFIFTLVGDSLINFNEYTSKNNGFINIQSKLFKKFFKNNPNIVLQYKQLNDGRNVFYGNLISGVLLDSIAQSIHADVALVVNDLPSEVSNEKVNKKYLLDIVTAVRNLKLKNNYDLYSEELANSDFVASFYTPSQILTPGGKISFIVFNSFQESAEFKTTLRNVAIIIVAAGSALTFIFVLLFTTKLRKQISFLGEAVEVTRKGNLDHRVPVILKDEVGKLGEAFNSMLDEIKQNKIAEKEYTEFIALINQNPSLQEISDAALSKIIKTTGLTFGVLYFVSFKTLRVVSSFGIGKNQMQPTLEADLYSNAIEKKEVVEIEFHENYPEIKTGLALIKIKYLLIYPIIYNKETIAILELASESVPQTKVKKYIENIHDQLAVGLINSRSLEQLENLVKELQVLNEEYQKQNKQIIDQNEKLRELHQQLQDKAEELDKQRVKALELTKVKSQFLASMSHELRTPLISILGLTELMNKDLALPGRLKERISIVYRNGKKLLGMITNILEFSKFESGRIELKKESFLLNELLDEILPGIKLITDEKKLVFELEKEPSFDLLFSTDKTKLEQILNNLLVNAVKFTEKGKIVLKIKLLPNKDVEFSVKDTGIGISGEHQKIIFAEFQQADSGPSRKFGGVGLGLAICKKYIELLGGSLELKSEPGNGSCFSFKLHDVLLDIIEEKETSFLSVTEDTDEEIKQKLLLITDKRDTEELIVDYFDEYGFDIVIASSYTEGADFIRNNEFNYILIDVLKQGSSWSFISEIKNDAKTQNIPVLLISIIEEEKIGWVLEVFDFISKPFASTALRKAIPRIEQKSNNKISDILFVDESKTDYEIFKNAFDRTFKVEQIDSTAALYRRVGTEIPDMILIDMDSIKQDSIDIVYDVKTNTATSKVPLVLLLPQDVTGELSNQLNERLVSITKKAGSHALDVMKELKEYLNIEDSDADETERLIEEQISEAESPNVYDTSLSKPTVLIVDDDSDSLFTIGEFVKELDYDTIFAHNGMECLITLNHVEPDLILLDIMMPQMDGFETIKRIRADERFSRIPVLALTAYAMLDNKNVIEKNGFDDLVTKPVNSKILASKIKEHLKVKVS